MSWPMMPEPQIKRVIAGFFARTKGGKERQATTLRSIINEVFAQGCAAGRREIEHHEIEHREIEHRELPVRPADQGAR